MTSGPTFHIHPVGIVRSALDDRHNAPRQGSEGAPDAWIEIESRYAEAAAEIEIGNDLILLTWLHMSHRNVLKVHPRGSRQNPLTGVFATRSPDRPNPIGLHRVRVIEKDGPLRFLVGPLEAIDGTPIVDMKPVLPGAGDS